MEQRLLGKATAIRFAGNNYRSSLIIRVCTVMIGRKSRIIGEAEWKLQDLVNLTT
jgi:hypothetical protein